MLPQPRTQALHCFYRDQWQLIMPSAQGSTRNEESAWQKMQIFVVTYRISCFCFFENCLPLIVYRGGNYGKFFTICHLKVIFTEYYRVLVLFYESLTYC